MFKKGDRVRCINTLCATSPPTEGFLYTVLGIDILGYVILVEIAGTWDQSRFELVASANQQQAARAPLPRLTTHNFGSILGPDPIMELPSIQVPFTNEYMGLPQAKCECGVDSVGGNKHSDWCPKHG